MKTEGGRWYLAIAGLTAAVFFVELRMPLGFTPWLLYVVPLGITYWAPYLYTPLIVATLCTVLVAVGYVFSPAGASAPIALTNRGFGAATFWILGLLILQYKMLAARLVGLTEALATEVAERTRDLGHAVRALQAEVELRKRIERHPSESGSELHRQVTNVLTAEGRRLQAKISRCEGAGLTGGQAEAALDDLRNELVELGHRLEQLQRELLEGERQGS